MGCNVGGLAGANRGTIKECYNAANVNAKYSCKENRIGGIIGVNEGTGIIENIYNTGIVFSKIFGEQLEEEDDICITGGVMGKNNGTTNNAYSVGKVINRNNEVSRCFINGVMGRNYSEISNCYYLENTISTSGINTTISDYGDAKSSTQMKSQELLDLLNQENSSIWKFSSGKNQGYPILYWE